MFLRTDGIEEANSRASKVHAANQSLALDKHNSAVGSRQDKTDQQYARTKDL